MINNVTQTKHGRKMCAPEQQQATPVYIGTRYVRNSNLEEKAHGTIRCQTYSEYKQ